VIPVFQKRSPTAGFRFGALSRLKDLIDQGKLLGQEATNLYRTLAHDVIYFQNFASLRHPTAIQEELTKRHRPASAAEDNRAKLQKANVVTYETLRDFFSSLLEVSTKTNNLIDEFISKVTKQANILPEAELYLLWLPFLRSLIPILEKEKISFNTPTYKNLFSALAQNILDNLGPQPREPWTWAVAGVPCDCSDCERVNAFLRHHTKTSEEYPMNEYRRNHVQQILEEAGVGCSIQTRRDTSPYPLVVTKTSRPQGVKLELWQKQRDQVLEEFDQIQERHLKTLLGKQYERIEKLHMSQKGQENLSQGPKTGGKRRIDE
ncbi:hypothetical protein IL306_004056, partial [Fusarium sp. DS 682]